MGCPLRPALPSLGDRRGPCPRRSPATADATPTMQARLIFGWRMRRAAVGTLVERTSGKVVLIKLTDAKASTTRDGFVEGMLRIPAPLRLTMTYDQGKEMA